MDTGGALDTQVGIARLRKNPDSETGGAFMTMRDNETLSGARDTKGTRGGFGVGREAALRRAIYLSNDMVMAHYHLGLLLLQGGAAESGRRVMSVVTELCRAVPEDTVLEEGDGLRAGDLLARAVLAVEPAMVDQASQP